MLQKGCGLGFHLPQSSSCGLGQVITPPGLSTSVCSTGPKLCAVILLMPGPFALYPLQIECSSISDYSEKIIKANHLDNSKTHLRLLSHGGRGRGVCTSLFGWQRLM